jgi:hypothetical protein
MREWTNVGGAEPPVAAAAGRDDAFSCYAFLSGLGAADTRELMSFKKITAEWTERLRTMNELFVRLFSGQDPGTPG